MKRCFKCAKEKPISAFYRHPMMADGHLGKCKECCKADVQANYERRRDARLAYERSRNNDPKRIASKRHAAKKWAEDPRHRNCIRAVHLAIKHGRMSKPKACDACSRTDRKLDAHHPDYEKPLDVMWLCRSCHRREHARQRHAESA